ncbi:myb-like protein D [Condylostylus longicornis]|uniref:myb-like protein D n=1 Tax=Condylostylus longicornis TaxID=2530218 RepID=UPI00244E57F5|nr:myb-like protein D [Condylostylus longicornis]
MKTIKERIEDIYKQIPFLETIKDPNVKKVVNILKKDIRNILNNQEKLEKLEHLIKKYKTISVYKNALEIEKKFTQQQRETEKVAQHETIVIYSSDEETDKTKDSTDDHQQYLIPPNKIKKEKLNDFKDTREKEEILFTRRKKSTENIITTVIEIIDSEDEVLTNSNHTLAKQNISVDNLKLELNENENSFNDELKNKSIRELEQIALNILKVGTNRNNTNPDSTSVDIRENFVENSSKSLIISQNVITPTANNLYTAVVPDQIFNIGSEINQIVRYNTPTPNIQVQAMSTTTDFSPTIYHQIPLNSYSSNTLFSSNSEISIENNQFCNIQHNIVDSTHSTNLCYNENFISASQNSESVIMPNCNRRKNLISNTADTSQPVSTTRKRKSSKDEDLSNKSENCSSNRQFNSKKLKSNILTDSTCTDNIVITNVRSINENEEKQKQMTTDDNEHNISSKPAKITRRRFTYHASDLNKVKESNDTSITQKVKQPQKMKGRRKSVCSHLENDVNLRELHGLQEQFLNWGYTLPEPKTHRPAFNKALQKIRRHSKVWDEEEIADLLSDEEIRKPKQSRRKSVCISEPEFENNRNSKDKNSALNISATARSKENEEKERSGKENIKIVLKKINCETSENCNSNQLKDLQFEVTAASNITKLDEVIETKSKISNTPKIIFRNTDQNLHCYNKNFMSKCVICDKTVNSIVSHYVNNHNNIKNHEIYCSRLPYYLIEKYKKKILEAKLIKIIQLKYRCKCAFCDKQIYGAPSDFYEHYSTHTGEYAWECDKCCKKLPHETKMIEHCEHCKKGGNPKRIYAYQEQSEVVGSFCAECKFIQLNKSNVIKHLENHHSIAREPERLCESLVLVKFSEKAKMTNIEEIFEKNFSELNTESFTEQKFNKPNSQELITVLNEPVCDYINNGKLTQF